MHDTAHSAHSAGGPSLTVRFVIALTLSIAIVIAQFIGSIMTGSLALLTDTAHALVDATGLLVALLAHRLSMRPPTDERTWGFRRIEVIAALAQASLLTVVAIYAAFEGIKRMFGAPEVPPVELFIFGCIGLACNVVSVVILSSARSSNLNMRAAFLEVLNDAFGSCAVIIAAVVIWTTGFARADAIAGLVIVALIVPRALRILRETFDVLMEFAPKGLDLDAVRAHILAQPHVISVHDLHSTTIATGLPIISAHVVLEDECFKDGHAPQILHEIRTCVAEHFAVPITHGTFQLEPASERDAESPMHADQ